MNDFPTVLPKHMKRALPEGVSLFPRPEKRRWVMKFAPEWKQIRLPAEIVRPDAAVAFVVSYLREQNLNPGAALEQVRVEGFTFGQCAGKWISMLEQEPDDRVAPATLSNIRGHLNNHIVPPFEVIGPPRRELCLGTTPITALDVLTARTWVRDMRTRGRTLGDDRQKIAPRTVSHIVSTARGLFEIAMAEQWVKAEANLFSHPGVLRELPKIEATKPIRLPLETVQALIDFAGASLENRARYVIAFTSGLRDGEIAAIRLDRLMLDGPLPSVEIATSVAIIGAKGKKGWAKEKDTKTTSSRRTLPLHHAAVAAIREWLAAGWPRLVKRQPRHDDLLFPRPDGKASRPRSAEFLRDDLRWAKLPTVVNGESVDFKAARSTFATWLTEAGVDAATIKRLLGHAAEGVTERHYTVREIGTLQKAVETIGLEWHGDEAKLGTPSRDVAVAEAPAAALPTDADKDAIIAQLTAELARVRSQAAQSAAPWPHGDGSLA